MTFIIALFILLPTNALSKTTSNWAHWTEKLEICIPTEKASSDKAVLQVETIEKNKKVLYGFKTLPNSLDSETSFTCYKSTKPIQATDIVSKKIRREN